MVDLVKANAVPEPPALPFEDVEVPLLGGVRVRGMLLSQRLAFRARAGKASDGSMYEAVPELLELTVFDGNGRPVYSRARWEQYGAVHEAAAIGLFNTAMRLSGLGSDDAKKN